MKRALIPLIVAALALSACGSDDDADTTASSDSTAGAPAESVTIERAWARTTAAGQANGAAYFTLTSAVDDTLLGASVPASVAADAQVHEVVPADMSGDSMGGTSGDDMGGMSGDGMGAMTMRELTDGLPLTAGETVTLEPGGYHIMLMELAEPLVAGDEFELTLEFATAGSITIDVPIADSAP